MIKSLKEKFKFFLPYWKKGIVPVLFLLLSTVISFVYPLFPKWAIDDVVMKKNHDQLLILVAAFLILVILQRVFSYLNEIFFFKFQKESIFSIQKNLLKKVFYYPMDFFDKNHSGYLVGRIRGDVAGLSYIFSSGLVMFFMDIIKFIGTFVILLTLNVKLTIISVCILPFLVLKIVNSRSNIKQVNKMILEENACLEKELSDSLQGIEVLKSFSKEEEGIKRTSKALYEYREVEVRRNVILSKYRNIIDFIVHLGSVLLLYFGIQEVITQQLTIGGYMAFNGFLMYLYAPVRNLSNVMIFFDYAKQSYNRIKELLDILVEDNGRLSINKVDSIEAKNLEFSYKERNKVLRNLSFTIHKGEKVLIAGESGTGKSTLVKLLLGLYRPQQGEILYNGNNLMEINLSKLREKVGYISQNIFLFNKTLRENIVLGDRELSDDRLLSILRECQITVNLNDGKVIKNEKLLDMMVAEKGLNLSGGERQRIALARALVKDPEIIIIDEGTSNIDIETEKEILKIIEKKYADKIIIRITHREIKEKNWKILNI